MYRTRVRSPCLFFLSLNFYCLSNCTHEKLMWFEYANRSNSSSCLFVILQEVDLKSELLCRCQEFYWRPRLALLQKKLFSCPHCFPPSLFHGRGNRQCFLRDLCSSGSLCAWRSKGTACLRGPASVEAYFSYAGIVSAVQYFSEEHYELAQNIAQSCSFTNPEIKLLLVKVAQVGHGC